MDELIMELARITEEIQEKEKWFFPDILALSMKSRETFEGWIHFCLRCLYKDKKNNLDLKIEEEDQIKIENSFRKLDRSDYGVPSLLWSVWHPSTNTSSLISTTIESRDNGSLDIIEGRFTSNLEVYKTTSKLNCVLMNARSLDTNKSVKYGPIEMKNSIQLIDIDRSSTTVSSDFLLNFKDLCRSFKLSEPKMARDIELRFIKKFCSEPDAYDETHYAENNIEDNDLSDEKKNKLYLKLFYRDMKQVSIKRFKEFIEEDELFRNSVDFQKISAASKINNSDTHN